MALKKPTIVCDTREGCHEWDFEGDDAFEGVVHKKLNEGDYSILGLEHLICIEKKQNCNELYTNLSSKKCRERFYAEAKRLSEKVKFRFIIIEQECEDVLSPTNYHVNKMGRNKFSAYMPPALVCGHLIRFMLEYGIFVIFAGSKAKTITKKILLMIYDMHIKGLI